MAELVEKELSSKIDTLFLCVYRATHGHSAVDVNLYAYGAQSHRLRGNHENTDIGHLISSLWNLDLPALTLRLNSSMIL